MAFLAGAGAAPVIASPVGTGEARSRLRRSGGGSTRLSAAPLLRCSASLEAGRSPTVAPMLGPLVLIVGGGVAGWLSGDWAGAAAGAGVGLLVTFGVAGAAAWWAAQVGRTLDAATAWAVAPRPPGFGPLCDAVYRRALGAVPDSASPEGP
jgi:hypothetical protein